MKNLLILGATGMVGGIVLREALNSTEIASVTSLARKKTGISHPKLKEVLHEDFADLSALSEHFQEKDIAIFCIGVYTGQVPDEKFREITLDFSVTFADTLRKESPEAVVCFLSGAGADLKEQSRMAFARYKGMAENHLIRSNFKDLYIFRPGYIYPVEKRKEPNFTYRLTRFLYPVLRTLYPGGVITSEELGKAMLKTGLNGAERSILENKNIQQIIRG